MKKRVFATVTVSMAAAAMITGSAMAADYKVGIIQFVDDASLNQIEANIEAELTKKSEEGEDNYIFEGNVYNGQADSTTLNQIATQLISDGVDVIIPIATPAAQIVQTATEDNQIPVVFSAVSDPVGAGLVESMDAPGANITGTSDIYIPLCLYFNPSPSPPLCIALILSLFVDLVYCSCPVLHFRFYLCVQWAFSPYFSCVFRILSTLWVLGLIGGRQSEQEVCCIVGFAPKLFLQPLFLSAFKDDDRVKFLIYCFFQFLLQLQQLHFRQLSLKNRILNMMQIFFACFKHT